MPLDEANLFKQPFYKNTIADYRKLINGLKQDVAKGRVKPEFLRDEASKEAEKITKAFSASFQSYEKDLKEKLNAIERDNAYIEYRPNEALLRQDFDARLKAASAYPREVLSIIQGYINAKSVSRYEFNTLRSYVNDSKMEEGTKTDIVTSLALLQKLTNVNEEYKNSPKWQFDNQSYIETQQFRPNRLWIPTTKKGDYIPIDILKDVQDVVQFGNTMHNGVINPLNVNKPKKPKEDTSIESTLAKLRARLEAPHDEYDVIN